MKKLILTMALALAGCMAFAQGGPWFAEIGVSYGMFDRSGLGHYSEIVDVSSTSSTGELQSSYRPTILPTFTFACGHKIPETFIGVFLDAAWSYGYNNMNGGPSLLREKENILHLMPEMRIYYMDNGRVRLYATLGAGMRYRRFSETFEGSTCSNQDIRMTYQVSPFGVSIGEKWYFSMDFGIGTAWYLMRLGGGYKF